MWKDDYQSSNFSIEVFQQYEGSNIEKLLKGIQSIRDKYIEQTVKSFVNDIFDITTAIGPGLDVWGKLLKFPRYLPMPSVKPTTDIQEFSFYNKNFYKLQFKDIDEADFIKLGDFEYRIILMMLLQKQNILPNIISVTELNRAIFESLGLGLGLVVLDSEDMQDIRLLASEFLPDWLDYILKNYDIILRPLCVGTEIVIDIRKPFGFYRSDAADPVESSKEISNFYYSNFEPKEQ